MKVNVAHCVFTSCPLLFVLSVLFGDLGRDPTLVAAGSKSFPGVLPFPFLDTVPHGYVLCRIPNGPSGA